MNQSNRYFFTKPFYISVLAIVSYSIICNQIPLLNYLGFEFSAATALTLGFITGAVTLSVLNKNVFTEKNGFWSLINKSSRIIAFLTALPFLISLSNAFFVKNCSITDGTIYYILLVIPSVIFSMAIAIFIGTVFKKCKLLLFSLIYILILSQIAIVTIFKPQIYAFNLIIGFFPGISYDESIDVIKRLLVHRLATIATSVCILTITALIYRRVEGKKHSPSESHKSFPILEIALLALFAPNVIVIFIYSDRLGLSSSEEFIKKKLVGHYQTTHFDIYYSSGSLKVDQIEKIALLHEFYYDELFRKLNLNEPQHIKSFIYASAEQKGKLIGAKYTNIAKPWLKQIHINLADLENVLEHEMTHVLAGEFGWSPFRIAKNSGLIEGLATAITGISVNETVHRAASLILTVFPDYPVEKLFTISGFMSENSRISYALSGSFCKYLIDTFGISKFKNVYSGKTFPDTYGFNLKELINMWEKNVKAIKLNSNDTLKAKFLFMRPSIFHKECVRYISKLNEKTDELLANHEYQKALENSELSLSMTKTFIAIYYKSEALIKMQRFEEAKNFLKAELEIHNELPEYLPGLLRLGDSYLMLNSLKQAKECYEELLNLHLSPFYDEACLLRLNMLQIWNGQNEFKHYLIYSSIDSVLAYRLKLMGNDIAYFILGKDFYEKGKFLDAIEFLNSTHFQNENKISFYAQYYLAGSYFKLGYYDKSESIFTRLIPDAPNEYFSKALKDWSDKCKYIKSRMQIKSEENFSSYPSGKFQLRNFNKIHISEFNN